MTCYNNSNNNNIILFLDYIVFEICIFCTGTHYAAINQKLRIFSRLEIP